MWQLSFVDLVTKSITNIVFHFFFSKRLVLTLTEIIIFQSEPEKQDKYEISEKKYKTVQILI